MTFARMTPFFLSLPLICQATELKPWFGNNHEVEIRARVLYQNYQSLSASRHTVKHNANDVFLTLSAEYPFRRYSGEFEVTAARTEHQRNRWDDFRGTGRYQWMNDADGDPFSLVLGITIAQPYSRALHDISSFHHGHLEGMLHLSIGKSYGTSCDQDYTFRWWNAFSIGKADIGKTWYREELALEYKYGNVHHFRAFGHGLWGAGKQDLHPRHFHGYGCIKHRSIDLGVRYGYTFSCWGTFNLQYARRVYAHNFPEQANLILFEYYYPLGNVSRYTY